MPKDYANIYDLPDEDIKQQKENLWKDSVPGTAELANKLLKKIEDDEYPFVLSVEASYGMGKTYFFSRFCEYANNNGYDCIYISAWENDYLSSPILFLCNKIMQFMKNKTEATTKSQLDSFIYACKELLSELNIEYSFDYGIQFNIKEKLLKLWNKIVLKKSYDAIHEFKHRLTEAIVLAKTKPLIIIVDELDRCRPDYALKTLEIIKHFFDINNLYIILPLNKEALEEAVKSTYGDIGNSENYLRKLITESYILPRPSENDYKKIVKTYIPAESLQKVIDKRFIEKNNNFNGYNTIINCITRYSLSGSLTYRELVKVCREFICIANKFEEKILVEYLAYKLCCRYSSKEINLNNDHPFYNSGYGENARDNILKIKGLRDLTWNFSQSVRGSDLEKEHCEKIKEWESVDGNFKTYEAFYKYIDNALKIKENILKSDIRVYNGKEKFIKFFEEIEKYKSNALEYQRKYGSTDKDSEKKTQYNGIVQNYLCLYDD